MHAEKGKATTSRKEVIVRTCMQVIHATDVLVHWKKLHVVVAGTVEKKQFPEVVMARSRIEPLGCPGYRVDAAMPLRSRSRAWGVGVKSNGRSRVRNDLRASLRRSVTSLLAVVLLGANLALVVGGVVRQRPGRRGYGAG